MAAIILLMPIKLLGMAICHIMAALIGAAGFVLRLAGTIASRIGSFIGGLSLLSAIVALIFQSSTSFVMTIVVIAITEIVSPLIILAMSEGMYAFRETLLDISEEIELY
ncbi:MAG: hypothetical protein MSH60_01370 [Ruminococcus sp.]|nr:hypothetical protein [Ruminococcus sp.]